MSITVDTNVLARAVLQDDPAQCRAARALLRAAPVIAVSVTSLCELVWILRQGAKLPKEDVSRAIRALLSAANVVTNTLSAEAGLAMLDAGGDFADGVIAHEGAMLGGNTFVTFDQKAAARLVGLGRSVQLLA